MAVCPRGKRFGTSLKRSFNTGRTEYPTWQMVIDPPVTDRLDLKIETGEMKSLGQFSKLDRPGSHPLLCQRAPPLSNRDPGKKTKQFLWEQKGTDLVSTGLEQLDSVLGGDGYPERSSILVAGPPGVGKEALGYWFMRSGLTAGDFCLYVTRLTVSEVLEDLKAFRISKDKLPMWVAADGDGSLKCDMGDLTSLSSTIKETIRRNASGGKRVRVVTDILSPLLMLNSADTIYRFFSQLLADSKQNNAVFLATLEEGMHQSQVFAAMEQLFDGVLELRLYEEGPRVEPLFRVRKMRGMAPRPNYFRYEFSKGKMEITPYVK